MGEVRRDGRKKKGGGWRTGRRSSELGSWCRERRTAMCTTQRQMDLMKMEGCRLKQRVSKLLRASLRSSCSITSRNVTHAVHEPVFVPGRHGQDSNQQDVFHGLHHSLVPALPSQRRRLHMQRREMSVVGDPPRLQPHYRPIAVTRKPRRKNREKARRVLPEREGKVCPPASRRSPSHYCLEKMGEKLEREERRIAMKKKKVAEERKTKKKLLSNGYGFTSSSSEDSDNAIEVIFGSDETETLFSSDSSEFYYLSSCRCSSRKKKTKNPQRQRRQEKMREGPEKSKHCGTTWVNGSRPFLFLSSCSFSSSSYLSGSDRTHEDMASAKVMEEEEVEVAGSTAGFAVEKQSSDPREDFRSSMLEMIIEKQVFGDRDLESLLLRYLSLNSARHHPVILEVFSEIRETLFGY